MRISLKAAGNGDYRAWHDLVPLRHRRRAASGALRHARLADLALHRLLLWRHGDPARRRGNPARRSAGGFMHRHRRLGPCRGADPFLAALGALHPERPPGSGGQAVLEKSRRFSSWARAAQRSFSRMPNTRMRAARPSSAMCSACGEKGDGFHRTRSSPDGAPIIAAIQGAIDDAGLSPDAIDYVNAHGTGTPENDKMESLGADAGCSASACRTCRFPPTSR